MRDHPNLRLLATENKHQGDLFERVVGDLFFSLGYHDLRLNVQLPGREIDVQGVHRFEDRRVLAECKAHSARMGGAELNKFFGVLSRERNKSGQTPISGYYVSLAGFTQSAVQQENDTSKDRLILLDGHQVVDALTQGKVIIDCSKAAERAGRCISLLGVTETIMEGIELLVHDRSYVWAFYYSQRGQPTHYALIHADGDSLAASVARELVEVDKRCGGRLHTLVYAQPPRPSVDNVARQDAALTHYRKWIVEECGFIQMDGLPADTDLSATRLRLESLFVPLKATYVPDPDDHPDAVKTLEEMTVSIGQLLGERSRLAVLAMPGGGKSTLLKRLATAYSFSERRSQLSDNLPDRDWLPLFLRCRELKDRTHRPLLELLGDTARHSGMDENHVQAFMEAIHARMREGRSLLLVDGLDEISDPGARQMFAGNLRTFLAMFPEVALIVTSREAGFRLVAGVVANQCLLVRLSPLDQDDVVELSQRWHAEVVSDTEKVKAEAKELGNAIWADQRLRTLVENPLLLTTLFVVRRFIRELPRNRSALFAEAIRVLVRTWNVEGYEPLDEEEALAQLSYVACTMMKEGKQQIGQKALLGLLQDAHKELDVELQFARVSPQQFIYRIEYRSSLLMQAGHELIDGVLQPIYEFRHLTFQEYLAARGYVQEQYPGRHLGRTLDVLLEDHFSDERWQQVIALAAVLAGRKAEKLIQRLTEGIHRSNAYRAIHPVLTLCVRDEVQVSLPTLRAAILALSYRDHDRGTRLEDNDVEDILRGKFGDLFRTTVEDAYFSDEPTSCGFISTLSRIVQYDYRHILTHGLTEEAAATINSLLSSSSRSDNAYAALLCMHFAYERDRGRDINPSYFTQFAEKLRQFVSSPDTALAMTACWAFVWMARNRLYNTKMIPDVLQGSFRVWQAIGVATPTHFPAWAIIRQRLSRRDVISFGEGTNCDNFLLAAVERLEAGTLSPIERYKVAAALIIGWYRESPWTDDEIVSMSALLAKQRTGATEGLLAVLKQIGTEAAIKTRQSLQNRRRR